MSKFLVKSEDSIPWDGNVPSDPGTYFIVEVSETLRVGYGSAAKTKPQTQQAPQAQSSTSQQTPSSKNRKQKIEVSDDDDDLDSVEIPTKAKQKSKPTVYSKGSTCYATIGGVSFERTVNTEAKAAELTKMMEGVLSDPTISESELIDKLKSTGKWKVNS